MIMLQGGKTHRLHADADAALRTASNRVFRSDNPPYLVYCPYFPFGGGEGGRTLWQSIVTPLAPSCTALARPSTALAVASLPIPPATRRKSPSCWQCCPERRRRREARTPCKMGLSRGLSLKCSSFVVLLSPFAHGCAESALEKRLQIGEVGVSA